MKLTRVKTVVADAELKNIFNSIVSNIDEGHMNSADASSLKEKIRETLMHWLADKNQGETMLPQRQARLKALKKVGMALSGDDERRLEGLRDTLQKLLVRCNEELSHFEDKPVGVTKDLKDPLDILSQKRAARLKALAGLGAQMLTSGSPVSNPIGQAVMNTVMPGAGTGLAKAVEMVKDKIKIPCEVCKDINCPGCKKSSAKRAARLKALKKI